MKKPNKRQIEKLCNEFYDTLYNEHIGFSNMKIDLEQAVDDFRSGVKEGIKLIIKINETHNLSLTIKGNE